MNRSLPSFTWLRPFARPAVEAGDPPNSAPASLAGRPARWIDPVMILGLALLAAVLSFRMFTRFPGGLVSDDGYFYAKIAWNIANHGFSSFDGLNHTDGYHQLWAYVLAGVGWVLNLFTTDKQAHLFAYYCLDFVLLGLTSMFASRNWFERVALVLLLLCAQLMMEGHSYAFLLAAVVAILFSSRFERVSWPLGVALVLLPTARIDASLVTIFLIGGIALAGYKDTAIKCGVALAAGIALHFSGMLLIHHHLFSVSSMIKTTDQRFLLLKNIGQRTPTLPIPVDPQAFIAIVLGLLSALSIRQIEQKSLRTVLWSLWLGTALFTFGHMCVSFMRPWYYAPAYIGFSLVLFRARELVPQSRLVYASVVATFVLGFGVIAASIKRSMSLADEAVATAEFARDLDQYVPANDPIYMVDGSGYVGFIADRPIIDGDGLVNSHAYAEKLVAKDLGSYLADNHIHYIITDTTNTTPNLVDIGGLVIPKSAGIPLLIKRDNGRYAYTSLELWGTRN